MDCEGQVVRSYLEECGFVARESFTSEVLKQQRANLPPTLSKAFKCKLIKELTWFELRQETFGEMANRKAIARR
jgi:hypothetical protein